jgi:hypothetical protein
VVRAARPVAYSSARWPDEIHFYAALLDDPHAFKPNEHYHWRNACTGLHQLTNCQNTRALLHSWVAKKMAVLRTLPQVPRRRDMKTLIPLKTHASTILFL